MYLLIASVFCHVNPNDFYSREREKTQESCQQFEGKKKNALEELLMHTPHMHTHAQHTHAQNIDTRKRFSCLS